MFEKIPSLKDFIIYFIPGILICYFTLDILSLDEDSSMSIKSVSTNSSVTFIGILFSFVVGFLFSQLQINLFKIFVKKRDTEIRTIEDALEKDSQEIKDTLVKRIKDVFEISGNDIEKDDEIVFSCLNFVKANANQETCLFIDRDNNLSSLALSITFPVLLAILDIFVKMKFSKFVIIVLLIIVIDLLVTFLIYISINFKKNYYKNIFNQFLILSKKKETVSP